MINSRYCFDINWILSTFSLFHCFDWITQRYNVICFFICCLRNAYRDSLMTGPKDIQTSICLSFIRAYTTLTCIWFEWSFWIVLWKCVSFQVRLPCVFHISFFHFVRADENYPGFLIWGNLAFDALGYLISVYFYIALESFVELIVTNSHQRVSSEKKHREKGVM